MFDILICGAGPAGLVSSIAFAKQDFSVAIVDPVDRARETPEETIDTTQDRRSTAHLLNTVSFLEELGIWQEICSNACALDMLAILNVTSRKDKTKAPSKTIFRARDAGLSTFGYNVPLRDSLAGLNHLMNSNKNISVFMGAGLSKISKVANSVVAHLNDGRSIKAKLIIGADGTNSKVREAMGIKVLRRFTGQTALAFHVTHEQPHQNTSTEIYSTGGPLTLVPMPNKNGHNASAVVWMQNVDRAKTLLKFSKSDFLRIVQEKSFGVVGKIETCSEISSRAVLIQVAKQIIGTRIALIGEAAHALPPIGAQGFNLSVKDVMTLSKLISRHKEDPGNRSLLLQYQANRLPDIIVRSGSIGILNILAWSENELLQKGRSTGLSFVQNYPKIKENLMKLGLS